MTIASNPALAATANAGAQTAQAAAMAGSQQLAGNFDTFLQLLTTQLQNQNPLDPLDTNQFTQQLVEFASVEQQVNMNTNLHTLISLQQTNEATSAMQLIGVTAAVKSNTAVLSNASGTPATWSFSVPSPATGQLSITNASGQTVFAGSVTLSPGNQTFTWSGIDLSQNPPQVVISGQDYPISAIQSISRYRLRGADSECCLLRGPRMVKK